MVYRTPRTVSDIAFASKPMNSSNGLINADRVNPYSANHNHSRNNDTMHCVSIMTVVV